MKNKEVNLKLSPYWNDKNLFQMKKIKTDIDKWRLAADNALLVGNVKTIDVDYEEVTDLYSLPELTLEFSKQLSEYNKLHVHNYLFNQPEHIAFLGHPLNHK